MGFTASDIADAFETKRRKRHADLEEWVTENPQWWAVGLATVGATSMDFLGGWVDALRLGEGAAESWETGSLRPVATDGLRVLTLLTPVTGAVRGAAAQAVRQSLLVRGLRLAARPKGLTGPCTFQAANNVARLAKGRDLFVTLKQMARAKGKNLSTLGKDGGKYRLGAWFDELLPVIRDAGIKASQVVGVNTIRGVVELTQRVRGVVVFAFKVQVRTPDGGTRVIHHTVLAWRGLGGRVKFADYGGKVFDTLEALIARWGKPIEDVALSTRKLPGGGFAPPATVIGTPRIDSHALVRATDAVVELFSLVGVPTLLSNAEVIETAEDGADIGIPVQVVASSIPGQQDLAPAEVVEESLENFTRRKDGRPPKATPPSASGDIPRSDWLTGVQFRLNHLGYCAGPVDGIMGTRTERAVRAFQKGHPPLKVDGIPGPRTQARLAEVCGY
jgi:hypothetical protein